MDINEAKKVNVLIDKLDNLKQIVEKLENSDGFDTYPELYLKEDEFHFLIDRGCYDRILDALKEEVEEIERKIEEL